ncbi:MAG: hypothetical protein JRN22_00800 [Nitrososphaerota archaeon]|nr:hypothetical protein [Nitrososphaerota archaeon]
MSEASESEPDFIPHDHSLEDHIRRGFYIYHWLQGPQVGPTFKTPESSFISGAVNSGKTRLLIRLALQYQAEAGAQIIDTFGAENDNESLAFLMRPKTRDSTLMIIGDEVTVDGWDNKMPISTFSLEAAKEYDVIVTDRALYGPYDSKRHDLLYYAALSRIFELVKRRRGQRRLICLTIREAWNVIYSQLRAGISRDEQAAMQEFRKLHNQRSHAKVAVIIDTQRYGDLAASVRSLVDFQYLKGFGKQVIPPELHYLYRPNLFGFGSGREWMPRNMRKNQFIILTEHNGVAIGWYRDISWHPEKGTSPLDKLGITVSLKQGETTPEVEEKPKAKLNAKPNVEPEAESEVEPEAKSGIETEEAPEVNQAAHAKPFTAGRHNMPQLDFHRLVVQLHDEGYSYADVTAKLRERGIVVDYHTVRYHILRLCNCGKGD